MSFGAPKRKSLQEVREAGRARAKRAALRALRRTRSAVEAAGADLSEWEGEFLVSVESRVEAYGRAYRDPEKGQPGASLSALQRRKLKEIAAKGQPRKSGPRGARYRAQSGEVCSTSPAKLRENHGIWSMIRFNMIGSCSSRTQTRAG